MTIDHGYEAQLAAEEHLRQLNAALDIESEGIEPEWPDSAGPYDGCETCVIRETLWAAWPHLRQAALEGAE